MKPRSPIKTRSAKRARLMRTERVPLVERVLASFPPCALGPVLSAHPKYTGCRGRADCLHERRKRGQGGSMINEENTVPACGPCNFIVEADAEAARLAHEAGLVVKRGDPGWAELGADRD